MSVPNTQPATEDEISAAKFALLSATNLLAGQQGSFFAQILFNCKKEFSEGVPTIGVGATNSARTPVRLVYNPKFVLNCSVSLLTKVLTHEAAHIALGHILKSLSDGKQPSAWRTATEFSANKVAGIGDSQVMLDGTVVHPITFPAANKALGREEFTNDDDTHSYYYKLMALSEEERQKCGVGQELEELQELVEGVNEAMARELVKRSAAQASNIPALLQRELGEFLNPKVRWQDVLRDTFSRNMSATKLPTPFRIHGRMPFVYQGSRLKPKLDVCVILDSSGSMGEGGGSPLQLALAETKALVEMVGGSMKLVCCDAQANITTVDNEADIDVKGGGGTILDVAFRAIAEMEELPSHIVCLTDGYNAGSITDIGIPTIFAIIGGYDKCDGANFGETILIE